MAPRTARPFPSRPSITPLEFLSKACPDAHAYTSDIIHSSLGTTVEDVIPQRNGFVYTVLECYNQHRALTIRPDDVWTAIITQFSCFVAGNAEALRYLFVLHHDRQELTVHIGQAVGIEDWDFVIRTIITNMKEQIQQNVIDPELKRWMIPAFSTTNLTDELVAGMVMMATVKEYFSYRAVLICGIPRVTLEGKKDDWVEILNRIEKLKEFGPQTTAWYRLLHPVLSRFVEYFDEPGSSANQEFWSKVVHYQDYGSGSTLICGWIAAFMAFDEKGRWKGDNKSDLILDGIRYPGLDSDEIPAGYAQVDVILQWGPEGPEHPTSLIAGSIGTKIFSSGDKTLSDTGERDSAMPALGWWFVFKKQTEPQKHIILAPGTPRWRFVDARAFVYSGAIRLVCHEDIDNLDFVAISYVWTDAIRKWINYVHSTGGHTFEEKITQGSGMFSASTPSTDGLDADVIVRAKLFFTIVAFFVLARGKKFFWIDVLCIDQGEQKEKSFFVPRMGDLYRRAAETHVYPFGANIPSSIFSDEVRFPIWETRAWAVQEHILSRSVLFCYALPGDVRQEFKNIGGDSGISVPELTVEPHAPMLDKYQYAGGIYLLHTKENTITCSIQQEMWSDLSTDACVSDEAILSFRHIGLDDTRRFLTRGSAYKTLSEMKKSRGIAPDAARMCMIVLSSGRQSTLPEDMMYSILGALDLQNFSAEYNIGFEEARLRVFEALSPNILALIIGTEWGNGSTTDNKDSALPRVVGATPIVGIVNFMPAIYNCKYTRNIGTQIECRHGTFRVWAPDEHNKADRDFLLWTSLKEGLLMLRIASVLDTPEVVSMPTGTIPHDLTRVIIADMSTFGVSSDEEASKIDLVAEFVDVGSGYPDGVLLPSLKFILNEKRSLLALRCEKTASGALVNKGTVLILDTSVRSSTTYDNVVIE